MIGKVSTEERSGTGVGESRGVLFKGLMKMRTVIKSKWRKAKYIDYSLSKEVSV
jgi:hypothetical protein